VTFRIEKATDADVPVILLMIRRLAEYERLLDSVTASEEKLREALFGPNPAAEVLIGYADEVPAGLAVFFQNFSTFLSRPGLYLEDLYVLPEWRRHGLGRQLLAHLAAIAVSRNYGRLEWAVLDWNKPAIDFYRKLGAQAMDEWTVFRLTGPALERLAKG
jgi:GNAT superfamily N-acetyltransferase